MQEKRRENSPAEAQRPVHCKDEDENEVNLKLNLEPCADNLSGSRAPNIPPVEPTIAKAPPQSRRSDLLDQLYRYISDSEAKSKEAVWLKSSKPSTISLKLQDIQTAVGPEGFLDIDTLNMAIRKLVAEDESLGSRKHCLSSDFARYAIRKKCRDADFETVLRNEFPSQNNYHNLEVLCVPVIHESGTRRHWSLYAFSLNDSKLYILDSLINYDRHADVRLDICEALEFTNEQFELFSNSKIEFKLWDYKFAEVPQQKESYDCGFFLFNFIRQWNGFGLSLSLHFHSDTMEMRKEFLSYILSFHGNEAANQLPSDVSNLIKQLSVLKPEKGTMDTRLLAAVEKGDVQGFQRLLDEAGAQESGCQNSGSGGEGVEQAGPRYRLLRGATSDGDGVLHMAARHGHVNMVHALLRELRLLGADEDFRSEAEVLGAAASNNQDGKGEEIVTNPASTCIQDRKGVAHEEVGETRTTTKQVPPTCNNAEAMVVSSSSQEAKEEACNKQRNNKVVLQQGEQASSSSSSSSLTNISSKEVSVSSQQEAADDWLATCVLRARNCKGETCLHDAVRTGDEQTVRMLLLADARLDDGTSPPLVQIRDGQGSSPLFMAKTACRQSIVDIIQSDRSENRYPPSDAGPPRTAIGSLVVDELYDYTMSLEDTKSKDAVWLSNSYPSPISLKLRAIQKTVKANGRMDADSLNFAIRKLERMDSKPWVRKHYISTDFARCAIYRHGGEHSSLETCIDDDFLDHHNAFDQDANSQYSHSNAEVLCIPVVYDSHWSLYAFNMNDHKVSILDPRRNCKCHKGIRPKICKALEFVKVKFNIFKNKSNDFSGWTYEVVKECGRNGSDDDSGFLVLNYMRRWDGHQLKPGYIPTDSKQMPKEFLAYILSFNDNESYQLPSRASKLIKDLPAGPAWTRCEMDKDLLKALREGNTDEFKELFGYPTRDIAGSPAEVTQGMRETLLRGTTCDGDGMFHIAVRLGKQQLLHAMKQLFFPSSGQENHRESAARQGDSSRDDIRLTILQDIELTLPVFAESLRARNNKGETCLHEAVRRGDKKFVESLILMDENEKLLECTPPLVQRVDYEGVSPLYLATTLRSSDIVGFLTSKDRKYSASYAGPGGKTAMHAAVLLDKDAKELTGQLLEWMKNVANIPDVIGMVDKSGNTPLHLLASVGGASIAELLLSPGRIRDESASRTKMSWLLTCSNFKQHCCCCPNLPTTTETSEGSSAVESSTTNRTQHAQPPSPCTVLKKDSNGWLPIHVAAANGRVNVIRKLLKEWPDCMQSRNDSGQSFLHVAIEKKMRNVVAYACGEQSLAGILNMRDRDGNTALHLAVKSGNQRMFCSLMSNKEVGLSFANKDGHTPLDLAILSIEPGLHFLLNSRVLIHSHLKFSGSDLGTYRRDLLEDDKGARKLDKDKLSETITKSAGLMAVCAIFMLNISVTAFFSVAKQYLPSTADPNAAAPPPLSVSAAATAGGKSAVARARAFKALIVSDAITFASSSLAAFCSTFAGFSIMDRRLRFVYLNIAGFSLRIACIAVVAVFVLAAYVAFAPTDPHIATAAYVLPLVAVTPQLITPSFILLLHAWAILTRFFKKQVSPRLHDASSAFNRLFRHHILPKLEDIFRAAPTWLATIGGILYRIASCCCMALCALLTAPVVAAVIVAIVAVAIVAGVIAFIVYVIINP